MNLGGAELMIVVLVIVVIFGAGWLPKAAKNLGKAKVEFDAVQKQLTDTKDSFVEATGVKELEATITKANKALNTSPKTMMKNAAKSTVTGSTAAKAATADGDIEDAEIVTPAAASPDTPDADGNNVNVDFG